MKKKLIKNIEEKDLKEAIKEFKSKKILLVTGKKSFENSGASNLFVNLFKDKKYKITRFSDFSINPISDDVIKGLTLFNDNNCDTIIAIGGGSVIDMGKLINVFQSHYITSIKDFIKKNHIVNKGVPLIAIPTTSGSGSEATSFAVIYHQKTKFSLSNENILPDLVGLNYKFTLSQSKYSTACTALDAMCQAIESLWSINSTKKSRKYSKKALKLIDKNIIEVVNFPNFKNKSAMCKASYFSGKAINISKTTAAHAMSYSITSNYNIAHGHAVFLSLINFITYNFNLNSKNLNDPRGIDFVKKQIKKICSIMDVSGPNELREKLIYLANKIDIKIKLSDLNICINELSTVMELNQERLKNNPKKIIDTNLSQFFIE